MKASLCLALLAILLNGCQISPEKNTLDIPNVVEVEKTGKHVQVPGTHIFIVPPKGTSFPNSGFVLRLAKNAEIKLEEKMSTNFQRAEQIHLGEYIHELNNNPFQSIIQYHKKFKLGEDSASLLLGKDPKNKKDEILMVVGNNTHSALIYCTLPENQPVLLHEALDAIKSIYIDAGTIVDYDANAPFSIDLSGSPFVFNSRKNALQDYVCLSRDSATLNKIIVSPALPYNKPGELNLVVESHKSTMKGLQILITDAPNKKVVINGYHGVESVFLATFPQRNLLRGTKMVYLLYLTNNNCSVQYACYIDASEKALFETARQMAQTIRLK